MAEPGNRFSISELVILAQRATGEAEAALAAGGREAAEQWLTLAMAAAWLAGYLREQGGQGVARDGGR